MSDEIMNIFDALIKKAEVYQIKKGDNFDKIVKTHPTALRNKLIVQELLAANPGLDPSKIQIGQTVIIPTGDLLSKIRSSREVPKKKAKKPLPAQIDAAFASAASAHGVSEAILRGMAKVESNGDICAQSPAGAQGLMQLMPQIQRLYGVVDPTDPVSSIWGAAAHLGHMMKVAADLLKYRPGEDVEKVALTMYNLGETAYRKLIRSGGTLPKESAEYADKVRAAAGATMQYTCNRKVV